MAPFISRGAGYGDEEPNDPSGWVVLGLQDLVPADGSPIPFRLLARRLKSSSPDAEQFLHNPLAVLSEEIEGVGAGWRVTTFIVNHHRTLSWVHHFVMAVVSDEEQTVALTIYKANPD